jgi:pyroglutamyl-peptidase
MSPILLTGFDPFGGEKLNPSWEAVRHLDQKAIEGHTIHTLQIPTVFDRSVEQLIDRIEKLDPALILCIGQAGGRSEITVERVAINLNDARIPDNEGNQPIDTEVVPGGPAAYFANLPVKAMVHEMNKRGIPASVSHTAGTFVCNHLFYGLMHYLAQSEKPRKGGFIHIPYLPEQAVHHSGAPHMSLETIVRGLEAGIFAALRYEEDIAATGGRIC